MNLIVVESPTKARTLSRYLGKDYDVRATYGHMRDLPLKKLGVDIKNNFEPQYIEVIKQKDHIKELRELAGKADNIYLATDPDREGEAIAWHVAELLKLKNLKRITFHEITESAIKAAMKNPGKIDMKLVDAQQARRVLDRLVGYKLSPLLWKKIRKGLSAGRVQSVALRMVVEREREIEAFKPEEFWDIKVQLLNAHNLMLITQLVELNDNKLKVINKEQAQKIEEDLRQAQYQVEDVEKREIKKTPPAPFTTSTLQQTAANKLGWSAKKTMQMAQSLYEEGHITYHRTDSTNLAIEAVRAAGEYIVATYGREYALDIPRVYKTKSKVAQEAHEAIRPTDVTTYNLQLTTQLNKDQARLYELIWKRYLACQMAEASGEAVKIKVAAGGYGLEVKGETIKFDGWLKIYSSQLNTYNLEDGENKEPEGTLPEVREGEKLEFRDLKSEQKFTQPPARYNDASLIKALEERSIGRPSTYAPIISTIQERQYVEKIEKRLKPTALGIAVNDFLVTNFPKIVDFDFTAGMESDLDEVANGDKVWQPLISDFYTPFEKDLAVVGEVAQRVKVEVELTGEKCPECKEGDVIVRIGRFGKFLACNRYPECKYKANFVEKIGIACPKCGGPARSATQSVAGGDVIIKHTKTRKTFFGCSNYPKCDFASWTKPTPPPAIKPTDNIITPEVVK